jgi:hypothetical protein
LVSTGVTENEDGEGLRGEVGEDVVDVAHGASVANPGLTR